MAGVTQYEPIRDCLSSSMFVKDGNQHRSNLLHTIGRTIELHAHSYGHTAAIKGRMLMVVITPEGQRTEAEVKTGERVFIPAWHKHSFTLLEFENGIGEVDCFWPVGEDQ